MTRKEAENMYRKTGLVTKHIQDKPGKIYQAHRHEKVYLFTLSGSARIKLDNREWRATKPGHEIMIGNNQLHEAIVGNAGWEYIFASSEEEAKRQDL